MKKHGADCFICLGGPAGHSHIFQQVKRKQLPLVGPVTGKSYCPPLSSTLELITTYLLPFVVPGKF